MKRKIISSVLVVGALLLQSVPMSVAAASSDNVQFLGGKREGEFTVTSRIGSSWGNTSCVEYTITNTGKSTIHSWDFITDFTGKVDSVQNGTLVNSDGRFTEIKNCGYNQDIQPGRSVTVYVQISDYEGNPSVWLLNTDFALVSPSDYEISYMDYSNWRSGYTGAMTIKNKSRSEITDWVMEFGASRPISSVSNAEFSKGDVYYMNGCDYNQNIAANSSAVISINGGANDGRAMSIDGVVIAEYTTAFSLSTDKDCDGIADYLEYIYGENNNGIKIPVDIGDIPSSEITNVDYYLELNDEGILIAVGVGDDIRLVNVFEDKYSLLDSDYSFLAVWIPDEEAGMGYKYYVDVETANKLDVDGDGIPDYLDAEM